MTIVTFPRKKRGCCEPLGGGLFCDEVPTRKMILTPMELVGGEIVEINPTEIYEKFWCEKHAPESTEPL